MRRRLPLAVAAVALAATTLTGCGSTTVDSKDAAAASSTVAPLPRQSTAAPSMPADAPNRPSGPDANTQGRDLGGREIKEIPTDAQLPREERQYLEALRTGGIDVEGVSDQLVGTAHAVCADPHQAGQVNVTALAVAGQLIAQNKTTLSAEQAAALIDTEARKAYC